MGTKLSPKDMELYRAVDEVLHYVWDPIGVSGVPQARDEYQSYLPQVFGLLVEGAKTEQIAAYLSHIATDGMGLASNMKHAREVAGVLVDWRDFINDQYAKE